MKKIIKILPILMVVLIILTACTPVMAKQVGNLVINPSTSAAAGAQNIGNQILGIIRVIGTVVAVGVLMVLGIKYMMGSAEEKAEYKKTMIPYLVGAILLFGAVNLASYIVTMASAIQ